MGVKMDREKRIYSLNLIVYVILKTQIEPAFYMEENVVYAVFPECRGVAYAIRDFKKEECEVELHKFLNIYRDIRDKIADMRGKNNGRIKT